MRDPSRPLTRRNLLRSAFIGGTGLLAASVVGCGDDDESAPADSTTPTGTVPANGTPAATTTPPGEITPGITDAPAPSLTWEAVPVSGLLPPARRDHSLVTDGAAVYLFGGRAGGADYADLWVYDPATGEWDELPAAGTPPGRFGHNAAYSPATGELLVFGGQSGSTFLNDTWAYSIANDAWTDRSTSAGPAARYGAAAAFTPDSGLIISHGFTSMGRFDDSWVFLHEARVWSDVSGVGARPEARCLTRGVFDEANERFVMFGGQSNSTPFLGDLWTLQAGEWTDITPALSPSPRNFYAMTMTGPAQAVLVGGRAEDGDRNDVWFLDTTKDAWTAAIVPGDSPSPRSGHDAVFLPSERNLYVFGGEDESGPLNDLWRLAIPESVQLG